MNNNQDLLHADLKIDHISVLHLKETAKWGKFVSIVGFVLCGLLILFALVGVSMMGGLIPGSENAAMSGALVGGFYFIAAIVYFFICFYLYRFSAKMQAALATTDQESLNDSFHNLKLLYRMIGIITIINVAIIVLAFLVGMGAAMMR